MINLNTPNKLPKKVKWCALTKLTLTIFLLSSPFLLFSTVVWFPIFILLIIFLVIPVFLCLAVFYNLISFIVENDRLTINSGVFTKRSKSITFDKIQNITNVGNIVDRIFGLSWIKIWTASPSQINIRNGDSQNKPDMVLWLNKDDSEWLKQFILDKHS
jgi:uncharacterized membrane protein YdbT with pleckstrin-like domain